MQLKIEINQIHKIDYDLRKYDKASDDPLNISLFKLWTNNFSKSNTFGTLNPCLSWAHCIQMVYQRTPLSTNDQRSLSECESVACVLYEPMRIHLFPSILHTKIQTWLVKHYYGCWYLGDRPHVDTTMCRAINWSNLMVNISTFYPQRNFADVKVIGNFCGNLLIFIISNLCLLWRYLLKILPDHFLNSIVSTYLG